MGKKVKDWRQATYYRYWMNMIHHEVPAHFGIRTERYKLIFFYGEHYLDDKEAMSFYWWKQYAPMKYVGEPAWEFYDLQNDPEELHNRYGDPAYQAIITELKEELARQREELGETDKAFPKIQKIVETNWNK